MSTKLYNGYKLPQLGTKELLNFTMNMRSKINEIVNLEMLKLCTEHAVDILDAIAVGANIQLDEKYQGSSALSGAWRSINDRYKKITETNQRDPECDFSCSVVFFPTDDAILALLYSEREQFTKAWEESAAVEPYPYWNNTDKPAEVTEDEWNKRRTDWENVLGSALKEFAWVPSMNGLTAKLTDDFIRPPLIKDVVAGCPSFDGRAVKVANTILFSKVFKQKIAEKQVPEQKLSNGEFWNIVNEAKDFCKSEAGKATLSVIIDDVKTKIAPVITEEMLAAKLPIGSKKCCGGSCGCSH